MANKKVIIDISTTTNTSGADKAQQSLEKIEREKKKIDDAESARADREIARANRKREAEEKALGVTQRRAEREARYAVEAAEKKERALQRERDAIKKTQDAEDVRSKKAVENANREQAVTSTKAGRGQGIQIQQAGFQVADFATQVGGGTSAAQALGQQLPQLLGAFGPWGAVIGAAAAVLIPLGRALFDVAAQSEKTKESADLAKSMIEKFGAAAKKAGEEDVQKLVDKLKNQNDQLDSIQAAELKGIETKRQVASVQSEIATSYLDAEAAALKYLEQTGQLINTEGRLLEIEKEKIKIANSEKIAAENTKVETARMGYDQAIQDRDAVQQDIVKLQKLAQETAASLRMPTKMLEIAQGADKQLGLKEPSANTQKLQQDVDVISSKLEAYYNSIDSINQTLPALSIAIDNAGMNIDQTKIEVDANIEKLNTQANLAETTATLSQSIEKQTEEVTKIKEFTASFEATIPVQQEAKARLEQATSDGKIISSEQRQVAGDLQILMATLNAGQSGHRQQLQELIAMNNTLITYQTQSNIEINKLKARVNSIPMIPQR
jgi:hypothetical protein